MSRIKSIGLDRFKKQDRDVVLGPHTLLVGTNGAGKSAAMEALVYALGGTVPTGKSAERVAGYFGPQGGRVQIYDGDSNFLERGIDIGKKGQVKEALVMEPDDPALWKTNEHLLDIRGFLALSPEKRRAFVLELVGAGKLDDLGELEVIIGTATAQELAGVGATLDTITVEKRILELPEELQPIVRLWPDVWAQLQNVARHHRGTASQLFQRFTKDAGEMKQAARRAGATATAAVETLEAGVRGARVAAGELDRTAEALEDAEAKLEDEREVEGTYREVVRALDEEKAEVERAREEWECAAGMVDKFEPLPEKPEPPEALDTDIAEGAFWEANERLKALEAERDLRLEYLGVETRLKSAYEEPVGELVARMDEVCSQLRPTSGWGIELLGLLSDAVARVASGWKARTDALKENRVALEVKLPPGGDLDDLQERIETALKACEELRLAHKALADSEKKAQKDYRAADKAWDIELEKRRAATELRDFGKAALEKAQERAQAAVTRLRGTKAPMLPELTDRVEIAEAAAKAAREAAGEVRAYERALDSAEASGHEERLWKAVEAAAKAAREVYVADVAQPLLTDIQEVLVACGRTEGARLSLETTGGRAIFELGWTDGEDRVAIETMSNGEAAIFLTALVVAISRRSTGRRILLVEGEPLTDANLLALLTGIGRLPDAWDACIVATPHEGIVEKLEDTELGPEDRPWSIVMIEEEG